MTDDEGKKLVREAVIQTLTELGIDVKNPLEMQRDFSHLRAWRESTEEVKRKGFLTLVGILVTGVAGAVWVAMKGVGATH
jgi:hypothetical protein